MLQAPMPIAYATKGSFIIVIIYLFNKIVFISYNVRTIHKVWYIKIIAKNGWTELKNNSSISIPEYLDFSDLSHWINNFKCWKFSKSDHKIVFTVSSTYKCGDNCFTMNIDVVGKLNVWLTSLFWSLHLRNICLTCKYPWIYFEEICGVKIKLTHLLKELNYCK